MASTEQITSGPIRDGHGRFYKGASGNPNGRPKGSKDKFTQLKDVFLGALEEVGGKDYVKQVARKDPKTFLTLVGKMLPKHNDIKIEENKLAVPIVISVPVGSISREQEERELTSRLEPPTNSAFRSTHQVSDPNGFQR